MIFSLYRLEYWFFCIFIFIFFLLDIFNVKMIVHNIIRRIEESKYTQIQ